MRDQIVCIVGMPGAGKSVVSDEFVRRGFAYLRFGQMTLDEIKKRGVTPNEANEKEIRQNFRKKYGMSAFALLNIPKLEKILKKYSVVVDGLYSWSEYKVLKKRYGGAMFVVAVYAPPKLRYARLEDRDLEGDYKQRFRSLTKKEARARDYSEIENLEKGGPIAMADFTIMNTGTIEELRNDINNILSQITKEITK